MKKVLLFFIMVFLVLISGRSLLCRGPTDSGADFRSGTLYDRETKKLKKSTVVARHEYFRLKRDIDTIIKRNIDETSIQVVLRLFDIELKLVNNLLNSKNGHPVQELLFNRDKLLKSATHTIDFAYKAVMNFATSDILFNKNMRKHGVFLSGSKKKSYLRRMKRILSQYTREFKDKQYYISQRTLGLPISQRYSVYAATDSQPKVEVPALYTSINTNQSIKTHHESFDFDQIEPNCTILKYYTPLFTGSKIGKFSRRTRSRLKDSRLERRIKTPNSKFAVLWGNLINRVQLSEVPGIVNEVLVLIDDESKWHVGSRDQRNKMFNGTHDDSSIDTDCPQAKLASREANILFGSIRDAATKDAMKFELWNPDVYEKSLDRYAAKLKVFKGEFSLKINKLKQELQERAFGLCDEFQQPFDGFIEKLSYNELPAR